MSAAKSQAPVSEKSVKERVSQEEWQTRIDLAAAYRLTAHYKWDDLIYTHIVQHECQDRSIIF